MRVGEVYKFEKCGNTVEVMASGVGTLVCCDRPTKEVKGHRRK